MGGLGSGRPRQHPVVEDGLTIDIGKLLCGMKAGSEILSGSISWQSVSDGEGRASASIGFFVEASSASGTGELRLRYTVADPWDGTRHDIDERIDLEGLSQPFGGIMWCCRCPILGRRCRKLSKPPGGSLPGKLTAFATDPSRRRPMNGPSTRLRRSASGSGLHATSTIRSTARTACTGKPSNGRGCASITMRTLSRDT